MSSIACFFKSQSWQGKVTVFLLLSTFCLLGESKLKASAQVVPDNTLPNNSVITTDGDKTNITGGTTAGSNLFHSFEKFSLATGSEAVFNNAQSIENIISRVTGGSVSNIDGLIRANGAANLFLINPNGIIFGPNAALNIGGSFIGSTADSLNLADGSEFSAVDPQAPPILEVNVPVGLQYGTNPAEIVVQGSGNNLSLDPQTQAVVRDSRPAGLQVQPEQTLALVGGNVSLEGGNLKAPGGRVELGSVGTGELVEIALTDQGWTLSYENVTKFQDIRLFQAASVDVSGSGGGDIQGRGRLIEVRDGSAMLADTLGSGSGGTLSLKASEAVEVVGVAENVPFFSGLFANVAPGATGKGGDLVVDTGILLVADGAQISSGTFSAGNAGTLKVMAQEVEVTSGSPLGPSGIFAPVAPEATGRGGNLFIDTERLLIADGAQVFATTFGLGDAGNLAVKATEVELTGTSPGGASSGLFANVEIEATGNGGNLSIDAERLLVADGAQIAAITFGLGDAGTLAVEATEVELTGTSLGGFLSGIFANVEAEAEGEGGDIFVDTESLLVADGAQIAALTASSGDAGDLTVQAQEVELVSGAATANLPSGLFTTVERGATGTGGKLTIETGGLRLIDGAQVGVSTAGAGDAGTLTVSADRIELIGATEQRASGLFAIAAIETGDGGDISVTTDLLTIQDGATINASNFSSNPDIAPGQGSAGNIKIEANSILLESNLPNQSSITASTASGGGGNIDLQVNSLAARNGSEISAETRGNSPGGAIAINTDLLELSDGAQISTNSTGLGQAGSIDIGASLIETNRGEITATSEQAGGGDIALDTEFLLLGEQSAIATSVLDSIGGGGDITIDASLIALTDNSNIEANAVSGSGGNIQISTEGLFVSPDSDITASSQFGVDGVVETANPEQDDLGVVELPETITDPTELIAAGCPAQEGNVFVVTGAGGLPENPTQTLRGETLWLDLRPPEPSQVAQEEIPAPRPATTSGPIIEAQGWIANADGKIELVAQAQENIRAWPAATNCEVR